MFVPNRFPVRALAVSLLATAFALPQASFAGTDEPDPSVHAVPASVLIFPLFMSQPGSGTILSVTNTDTSRVSCDGFYLSGDICAHFTYVNNEDGRCFEFDRFECLTPGDTLTVLADEHNPEMEEGWLWIEALDPSTLQPIVFNSLIGSAIIVETGFDFSWGYTPYSFRALPTAPCEGSVCAGDTRCYTDLDGEIDLDFDGMELERFPDSILIDQFFEEENPDTKNIKNELTLMSTSREEETNYSFVIWNNSETRVSRGFSAPCHFRGPLSQIAAFVLDLGGTDMERFQTGWVEIDSAEGILGVFKTSKGRFGCGKELIAEGAASDVSIDRFDLSGP